ncbi:unnamed protein product [Schistosoma curassoni]|uniref:G-protein coupled receptors family 1 profile domain-containing protein n=1 Tax=Schistosoma curassoni TaxID=6186 RepID=A0A183KCA9_9TREM|nr:unnamed protein product [Schistosoma curassoni]
MDDRHHKILFLDRKLNVIAITIVFVVNVLLISTLPLLSFLIFYELLQTMGSKIFVSIVYKMFFL